MALRNCGCAVGGCGRQVDALHGEHALIGLPAHRLAGPPGKHGGKSMGAGRLRSRRPGGTGSPATVVRPYQGAPCPPSGQAPPGSRDLRRYSVGWRPLLRGGLAVDPGQPQPCAAANDGAALRVASTPPTRSSALGARSAWWFWAPEVCGSPEPGHSASCFTLWTQSPAASPCAGRCSSTDHGSLREKRSVGRQRWNK